MWNSFIRIVIIYFCFDTNIYSVYFIWFLMSRNDLVSLVKNLAKKNVMNFQTKHPYPLSTLSILLPKNFIVFGCNKI